MAKLIFNDGSEKVVEYNIAAKIYQILQGNAEPDGAAQAFYVLRIKSVEFDKINK